MTEAMGQAHWEAFFDAVAKKQHGFEARMEVIGQDFGHQAMATWLPFTGSSYQTMAEDHARKSVGECHPYREFEGMQSSI